MPKPDYSPIISDVYGVLHRQQVRFEPSFHYIDDEYEVEPGAERERIGIMNFKQYVGDRRFERQIHVVDLLEVFTAEDTRNIYTHRRSSRRFSRLVDDVCQEERRGQHVFILVVRDGFLADGQALPFQSSVEMDIYSARKIVMELGSLKEFLSPLFNMREGDANPVHYLPDQRRPWQPELPEVTRTHHMHDMTLMELLEHVATLPQVEAIYRKADRINRTISGSWRYLKWAPGEITPTIGSPWDSLPLAYECSSLKTVIHLSVLLAWLDETAGPETILELPTILETYDSTRRYSALCTLVSFVASTRFGLIQRYSSDTNKSLGDHLFGDLRSFTKYKTS